jgi:dihydrofolate synthase/folylpolyglutamate synthase
MKDFKYERLIAVVSISSDKDIPSMMEQLAQVADYFVITAHRVMGRAADPLVIANEAVRWSKPFEIAEDVENAIDRALTLAHANDLICVTGSVFLVGEARGLFKPLEKKSLN